MLPPKNDMGVCNMFPPIPLIRRNHILSKLRSCGAVSAETARTFKEAGIINPNAFAPITERLVNKGVIARVSGEKYYLK